MNMLKVAGNNENGQPRAFLTDDAGRAVVVRKLESKEIRIVDSVEIRSTDANWSDRVDVSEFAFVSLRIGNSLDQPVNIIFGLDTGNDNTSYMKNYGGTNLGFTIPANSGARMVTPEEFPFLQYLEHIKLRYSCGTEPTEGKLSIAIVGRG